MVNRAQKPKARVPRSFVNRTALKFRAVDISVIKYLFGGARPLDQIEKSQTWRENHLTQVMASRGKLINAVRKIFAVQIKGRTA